MKLNKRRNLYSLEENLLENKDNLQRNDNKKLSRMIKIPFEKK